MARGCHSNPWRPITDVPSTGATLALVFRAADRTNISLCTWFVRGGVVEGWSEAERKRAAGAIENGDGRSTRKIPSVIRPSKKGQPNPDVASSTFHL